MPKIKTHSGAKKRFRLTSKGKVRFKRAKRSHILTKKSSKWKRKARANGILSDADTNKVKRLLGKK
jgi:large subunit ribosomal protein L35